MSRLEKKLNNDINELQKFVHDTRRQAIFSQGNRTRQQTFSTYYNLLINNFLDRRWSISSKVHLESFVVVIDRFGMYI